MKTITKEQAAIEAAAVTTVDASSETTTQAENQAVYESSARDYQAWAKRVLHAS